MQLSRVALFSPELLETRILLVHKIGTAGPDVLEGTSGEDTLEGRGGNDTLSGFGGADRLEGGQGNDVINGGDGGDFIIGEEGDDTLHGNNGHDEVYGGTGTDQVYGDDGNDTLYGGEGNDKVYGGEGDDVIRGYLAAADDPDTPDPLDFGADELYGGNGADVLRAGSGADLLYGEAGNDRLFGGLGSDFLFGGDGNDELVGTNKARSGGDGGDILDGGAGDDTLEGGGGNDTFVFNFSATGNDAILDFLPGADKISLRGFNGPRTIAQLNPTVVGGNTRFTLENGQIITVQGRTFSNQSELIGWFDTELPTLTPAGPFTVAENSPVGTVVGTIPYTDPNIWNPPANITPDPHEIFDVQVVDGSTLRIVTKSPVPSFATQQQYVVTVRIRSGVPLRESTREYVINVLPTNHPPEITSNGSGPATSIDVDELQTFVTDVNAIDPNGDPISYSISGGVDAAKFTINSSNGILSFLVAPQHDNPTDSDQNNIYHVTVRASDGISPTSYDEQSLSIEVQEIVDPGYIISTTSVVTTEAGGAQSVSFSLKTQPTSDVLIYFSSQDTSEATVSPEVLTFTPGNWSTSQSVTITGVDDPLDDGDIAYTVVTWVSTLDPIYAALNPDDISGTNTDDDPPVLPELGSISGTKWEDLDGDGQFDSGYVIPGTITPVAAPALYITLDGTNSIARYDLTTETVTTVIDTGLDGLRDIAVDPVGGYLFWADDGLGTIMRSELSGSNPVMIATGLSQILAVVVDPVNGKLYWADNATGQDRIERANLDGSQRETILTGTRVVTGLVLDPAEGHLYWAQVGGTGGSQIGRVDWDGSNAITLVSGLSSPETLAIDPLGRRLFWGDQGTQTIERIKLDGSGRTVIVNQAGFPKGMAFDTLTDRLYWGGFGSNDLRSVKSDGTQPTTVLANLSGLEGLALNFSVFSEPVVSGVTVTLTGTNASGQPVGPLVTTTDTSGNYQFADLEAGTYTVTETVPNGWGATTSVSHVVTLAVGQDVANQDFGNYEFATVSGTKWEDLNGDGDRDAEDSPRSGITITLTGDIDLDGDADTLATTTAVDGTYSFTGLAPGEYIITETVPNGWQPSSSTTHTVTIISGDVLTDLDFLNYQLATLSGTKWWDLNGNGLRDFVGPETSTSLFVSAKSDPWLAGMPDGSTSSPYDSAPGQSPTLVTGLTLTAGTTLRISATGLASYHTGFNDLVGPDGLPGNVSQHAFGAANGISNIAAPASALIGVFLSDAQPDFITAPANYTGGMDQQTIAPLLQQVFFIGDGQIGAGLGAQDFIVPAGATRLFLGMMDGAEWSNNEGGFQVTVTAAQLEPALEDVTIYLDLDRDGNLDVGEPQTVTDSAGHYAFEVMPGNYVVREVIPAGYLQTYPVDAHTVTVLSGDELTNLDFGNRLSNTAPVITSGATATIPENSTAIPGFVTAIDSDLPAQQLHYFITGGVDASLFQIDELTGVLSFIDPPDFESPSDLNQDNVYLVSVEVTDGTDDDQIDIAITISDANEAPSAVALENTIAAIPDNANTSAGIKLADIVVTDDALGTNTLSLTGDDAADFEIIGTELWLKAGTVLNISTQQTYSVTVQVDDLTVGSSPDASTPYILTLIPTPRLFDFGTSSSPVYPDPGLIGPLNPVWTPVLNTTVYSAGVGYGWLDPNPGTPNIEYLPQGFNRGTLASPLSRMSQDGNLGTTGTPQTFQVDLAPNTDYDITWMFGDTFKRVNMNLAVVGGGTLLSGGGNLTLQGNEVGEFKFRTFRVQTDSSGQLQLRFSNTAGGSDNTWIVSGLSFLPTTDVIDLGIVSPGTVGADSTIVDTITVPTYVPGATYTIKTTLGKVEGADADSQFEAFQVVAPVSGAFTFQLRRPYTAGTATVTVEELTGRSSDSFAINYTDTYTRHIDFNGTTNVTTAGYVGQQATSLFNPAVGYGWVGGGMSQVDQAGGTAGVFTDFVRFNNTSTFQIHLDKPVVPVTYQITLSMRDVSSNRHFQVSAEGVVKTNAAVVSAAVNNTYSFTISSSDLSADEILDLKFEKYPGASGFWVLNAIDIVIPQVTATGGKGTTKSPSEVTESQLAGIIQAAIGRFAAAGASEYQIALLLGTTVQVKDLGANGLLGLTYDANTIHIDQNGAGHGWYVDRIASDDSEFRRTKDGLKAKGPAKKQMDILSVVVHEFTNILKLNGEHVPTGLVDAENIELAAGQRWSMIDSLFGSGNIADDLFAARRGKNT